MKDFQNFSKFNVLFLAFILNISIAKALDFEPPHNFLEPHSFMCDLCSCSTGSGSFGFGTLNNANFVGLRYINQTFESRNGIFVDSPKSIETFNTYQLWTQLPVNDTFFVTVNLPYQHLKRTLKATTESLKAMGDISSIAWYKLQFYKKAKDSLNLDGAKEASGHSLLFGLGVKLPTGKFEEALANNVNPGFQVGTGSVDGILSLGYNYAKNKVGVNTLVSYYFKGENKNEYQFGNQLSYSANFYKVVPFEKMNLISFVGMSGDVYDTITQYGQTLSDTNGNILNGTLGTELVLKKLIFGVNYTLPIHQDLFGGNVESKNRFSLYINAVL